MSQLEPPDPFDCPFRRQCWLREGFRWLATAIIALIVAWTAGCSGQLTVRGPGFDISSTTSWPWTSKVELSEDLPAGTGKQAGP